VDARVRLGGDFDLFISMLKRLLGEFSDLSMPASSDDAAALAALAACMHKLRGSAGMLGARTICQLAGAVEVDLLTVEGANTRQLTAEINGHMERLRASAAPALVAAQAQTEGAALAAGGELMPQELFDLIGLLRQQSLSATERFASISPQLRRHLGKASYDAVRDHVDNLEFTDAADALDACQR